MNIEYLVNTINADSDLLHKLSSFFVINNVQLKTIESKRTTQERNQELLNVISKTSPKSFYLFLSALVATGRSNILEKLQLMHPGSHSDTLTTKDGSGITDEEVNTEMETDHENKSEPGASEILTSHQMVESEETSIAARDREAEELKYAVNHETKSDKTFINLYTVEGRKRFGSKWNKKSSISELISFVIKSEDILPAGIRNILFLKKMAMSKRPSASIKNLSRHLSCLLGYVSEMYDNIRGREILSSNYTAMGNLSLIIEQRELTGRLCSICLKS